MVLKFVTFDNKKATLMVSFSGLFFIEVLYNDAYRAAIVGDIPFPIRFR